VGLVSLHVVQQPGGLLSEECVAWFSGYIHIAQIPFTTRSATLESAVWQTAKYEHGGKDPDKELVRVRTQTHHVVGQVEIDSCSPAESGLKVEGHGIDPGTPQSHFIKESHAHYHCERLPMSSTPDVHSINQERAGLGSSAGP
jgi:hypothetical protein